MLIKATQPLKIFSFAVKNMEASLEDWNLAGSSDQANEVADEADENRLCKRNYSGTKSLPALHLLCDN